MDRNGFLTRFHHLRQIQSEADYPLRSAGRPAAVLIALVEHDDALTLLLTRRASHLRHHPGQISFPGGKIESTDASPIDAALREANEEIGLPASHTQVVGQLPEYRTITGYTITPVVALVKPGFPFIIDKNEVDEAFEVPLKFVLDKRNHLIHQITRQNLSYPVYFIPWQDKLIWGATAALIRTLSHHVDIDF